LFLVDANVNKQMERVIEANFTMVARDDDNKASSVRPLEPQTAEEVRSSGKSLIEQ